MPAPTSWLEFDERTDADFADITSSDDAVLASSLVLAPIVQRPVVVALTTNTPARVGRASRGLVDFADIETIDDVVPFVSLTPALSPQL